MTTNATGAAKKAAPTGTEALRAAGFVHANRGPYAAHDIYDAKTGDLVARLHADEVWGWLKRGEQHRFAAYRMTLDGARPTNVGFMAYIAERLAAWCAAQGLPAPSPSRETPLKTEADHAAFTAFLWESRR